MIYPVILCGGQGTRLWPISKETLPKQFIKFNSKTTLLQNTLNRIKGLKNFGSPHIITHYNQRFLVEEQMDSIGIASAEIILEPEAKSTAPAITLAALHIAQHDREGIMLVLSADNDIKQQDYFRRLIIEGTKFSQNNNKFLLFGSKPSYCESGYGYIKANELIEKIGSISQVCKIEQFIEKPSTLDATKFIKEGFYWNSGIFILPIKLFLNEIKIFATNIYDACNKSIIKSHRHCSSDHNYFVNYIDSREFAKCPIDSIDYALMEKTAHAAVIKTDIGWSDIGTWSSIYSSQKKDNNGNVIKANSCISINNQNVQVYSSNKTRTIAALNLQNITIIDSEDAILVLDTNYSQDVKKIINQIKLNNKSNYLINTSVHLKWGSYEIISKHGHFIIKKIIISPTCTYTNKGSLKSKHFMIIKGLPLFTVNGFDKSTECGPKFSMLINPLVGYEIYNKSTMDSIELLKVEF